MNVLWEVVFNGVNFMLAFLVWGIIFSCRKGLHKLKHARTLYLLATVVATPLVVWLYMAKTDTFAAVDFGWNCIIVFVLANIYHKGFKKLATKIEIDLFKKTGSCT